MIRFKDDICQQGEPNPNARTHKNVQQLPPTFQTIDDNEIHVEIEYECLCCGKKLRLRLLPT